MTTRQDIKRTVLVMCFLCGCSTPYLRGNGTECKDITGSWHMDYKSVPHGCGDIITGDLSLSSIPDTCKTTIDNSDLCHPKIYLTCLNGTNSLQADIHITQESYDLLSGYVLLTINSFKSKCSGVSYFTARKVM